jgi:hypothetical protein
VVLTTVTSLKVVYGSQMMIAVLETVLQNTYVPIQKVIVSLLMTVLNSINAGRIHVWIVTYFHKTSIQIIHQNGTSKSFKFLSYAMCSVDVSLMYP